MSATTSGRGPSTGRLLGLTALTLALAVAVGVSDPGATRSARPSVVPGLTIDELASFELEVPGRAAVTVELADGGPRITAPAEAAADERAVRDLISAVASARVDRWGEAGAWGRAALDHPRAILRLHRRGGATVELRVGLALTLSGQTWLGVGRRPALAPAWLADALVRNPDNLRRRRPFPAATVITALELHAADLDLVLSGAPLRRHDLGARVALDPARRDRLLDAVAGLTVESTAPPGAITEPTLTVRIPAGAASVELVAGGPCPGQPTMRAVETTIGAGCVAAAALAELTAGARALIGDDAVATAPIERFDRTTVVSVELGGSPAGQLLAEGGGWRIVVGGVSRPVDGLLAADLATALTTPAVARRLPEARTPTVAPERWTVRRVGGEVEVWEVARGPARVTIRRAGEPVVLELALGPAAVVRGIGPDLRDRTLVAIDPVSLTAIEATGEAPARLVRGALVDEWLPQSPLGAIASPAAAALGARLAGLRASAWVPDGTLGRVRRTVRVTVEVPGAVGPRVVILEVFGAAGSGCGVRVDGGRTARLGGDDCVALRSPLVVAPRR